MGRSQVTHLEFVIYQISSWRADSGQTRYCLQNDPPVLYPYTYPQTRENISAEHLLTVNLPRLQQPLPGGGGSGRFWARPCAEGRKRSNRLLRS